MSGLRLYAYEIGLIGGWAMLFVQVNLKRHAQPWRVVSARDQRLIAGATVIGVIALLITVFHAPSDAALADLAIHLGTTAAAGFIVAHIMSSLLLNDLWLVAPGIAAAGSAGWLLSAPH